MKKIWCSENPG